jgi:hypothetical protein
MVIDQRNAGAVITPTNGQYTVDRWNAQSTQSGKYSVQQNSGGLTGTNLPAGFTNYLGAVSLSAYSVISSDGFGLQQRMEGYNVADLGWGTANAKTITVSAWVRSSLTGTFGGALFNDTGARSYPFTYSIPVANTWTYISVTIPGDTSGTWLTTNGASIQVTFSLGAGSGLSGTAGAWAGAYYVSATGAVSVVGTNTATFYLTGVQFEVGTTATNFEVRSYGTELALCQRYYFQITGNSSGSGFGFVGNGNVSASSQVIFGVNLPATMRATPTASFAGTMSCTPTVGSLVAIQVGYSGNGSWWGAASTSAVGITGAAVLVYTQNAATNNFSLSAEL